MRSIAVALVAFLALHACSKTFKCNLTGVGCPSGPATSSDVPLAELGQSCEHATCTSGAYCNYDNMRCTALRPKGSACKGSLECDGQCSNGVCE